MIREELININYNIVNNNKKDKITLVNGYMLSTHDTLKKIEKEYTRIVKSKRFYDYYEADTFYSDLTRSIAQPLEKIANKLPEQVERLSVKIMLEFERFSENTDTSCGSWMDYYSVVIDAWMKSLSAQKNSDNACIAKKVMDFIAKKIYFCSVVFKKYQSFLGTDVLREIRDMYYQKKCYSEALNISVIIKDTIFLSEDFKKAELYIPEHYFDYARLLIDEFRPGEAIELLLRMETHGNKKYS